ncbi:MAG: hypothetical protein KDD53_12630 [Bdellovibrionales bacterium]|nr:hypothetical protein [Bdellovibrionales bacterium]
MCDSSNHASANLRDHVPPAFSYWVGTSDILRSELILTPGRGPDFPPAQIRIYDCDGELVNELEVQLSDPKVQIIELDSMMQGCKVQAGFRHGHVQVRVGVDSSAACRYHWGEAVSVVSDLQEVSSERAGFFPVRFSKDKLHIVALVNHTDSPAESMVRLILGRRTPEVAVTVPGLGARIVSLESNFAEFATPQEGKERQGYLRVRTKENTPLGLQLIEELMELGSSSIFTMVA